MKTVTKFFITILASSVLLCACSGASVRTVVLEDSESEQTRFASESIESIPLNAPDGSAIEYLGFAEKGELIGLANSGDGVRTLYLTDASTGDMRQSIKDILLARTSRTGRMALKLRAGSHEVLAWADYPYTKANVIAEGSDFIGVPAISDDGDCFAYLSRSGGSYTFTKYDIKSARSDTTRMRDAIPDDFAGSIEDIRPSQVLYTGKDLFAILASYGGSSLIAVQTNEDMYAVDMSTKSIVAGSRCLYYIDSSGNFCRLDMDTRTETQLSRRVKLFAASADSSAVCWMRTDGAACKIYMKNADSAEGALIDIRQEVSSLLLSADGTQLLIRCRASSSETNYKYVVMKFA